MKDFIPSWLEDPSAYAQPANLDMSTVIVVALTNLWVGIVCVTFFEVFRRRSMRIYSPKAKLCPGACLSLAAPRSSGLPESRRGSRDRAWVRRVGTTPSVMHVPGTKPGAPLSWVKPLMRLDEEEILRYGGYDVLIYLRFMSLSLRIFGSFAPYAFLVLLPVNASVSYWPGTSSSADDDGATSTAGPQKGVTFHLWSGVAITECHEPRSHRTRP